jgi:hypothetical protein
MCLKMTRDDPGADRFFRVELRNLAAVCDHAPLHASIVFTAATLSSLPRGL